MNIKAILCVYFLLILSYKSLSQTFVPDDNFEQALIDLGYDSGPLDDNIPTANISTVTNLDVNSLNIADLTGIEDFVTLTVLNCSNNVLNTLDVTNNTSLTQLFCDGNSISALNVSVLANLQILWCQNNQISTLNVSNNTSLISLVCGNNLLTNLDVTNNTSLNVLSFESNQISSINITNNSTLNFLHCGDNGLAALDISQNSYLSYLDCSNNQFNNLDTSNNPILDFLNVNSNNISYLDLSQNPSLTEIDCGNNQLCQLNVRNGNNTNIITFNFQNNPDLNCVIVDNPTANHNTWNPTSFTNYVASENDCSSFVAIDTLPDVIAESYTLPTLNNGDYFTESGGSGNPLFAGETITSSQTIYIYNETVCDTNESNFNVLITTEAYYIPKYFTPNNDGNHDVWMVQDFSNTITDISIFDHYGKLLKYLLPNNIGWDGTYNGKPMETNDYWYVITFNTGETRKGHFTLKR